MICPKCTMRVDINDDICFECGFALTPPHLQGEIEKPKQIIDNRKTYWEQVWEDEEMDYLTGGFYTREQKSFILEDDQ